MLFNNFNPIQKEKKLDDTNYVDTYIVGHIQLF